MLRTIFLLLFLLLSPLSLTAEPIEEGFNEPQALGESLLCIEKLVASSEELSLDEMIEICSYEASEPGSSESTYHQCLAICRPLPSCYRFCFDLHMNPAPTRPSWVPGNIA